MVDQINKRTKAAGRLKHWLLMATVVAGSVGGMLTAAQAQTVSDISKRGKVIIGIDSGTPLYAVIDSTGNNVGYDVDVANLIGKYLGVGVELVPLSSPARIPALQAGKVDLLVASLSPTPERAKTIMFTMPYSVFNISIMAPKSLAVKTIDDLKGKTVAFNQGTSQQDYVQKLRDVGANVVYFGDDALTGQALLSNQADAVGLPENVESEFSKKDPNLEVKYVFHSQANALAVRPDAFELHQWLNNFIYHIKSDGELNAISQKWLNEPLPVLPTF